jgi:hypothetical protein
LQILLTEYLALASDVCVVFLQKTSLIVDNLISFEVRTSIESSNLPFDHAGKPNESPQSKRPHILTLGLKVL